MEIRLEVNLVSKKGLTNPEEIRVIVDRILRERAVYYRLQSVLIVSPKQDENK